MLLYFNSSGLDWGGLRREWIELLCVAIFDHSGMFTKLSDDNKAQSLVHPNSNIPASFKLKHYEFAGKLVGKCLYESSLGPGYRQFVKVIKLHFMKDYTKVKVRRQFS